MAADHLSMRHVITNLIATPTSNVAEIATLDLRSEAWQEARDEILPAVLHADAVLLAYGIRVPSGPNREPWQRQVEWLLSEAIPLSTPCWMVGEGPTHPSRWQRVTTRVAAGVPMQDVLPSVLNRTR
jgi:hypothetical protein